MQVEVEGDVDPRGVLGIDDVDPGFEGALRQVTRIESPATEAEVRDLVEQAESHCPAYASLSVPVERTLVLNDQELEL